MLVAADVVGVAGPHGGPSSCATQAAPCHAAATSDPVNFETDCTCDEIGAGGCCGDDGAERPVDPAIRRAQRIAAAPGWLIDLAVQAGRAAVAAARFAEVIYERRSVTCGQGAPMTTTRGLPLVFDPDLGWMGHDDEFPTLSDGGYTRMSDSCSGSDSGMVERVVRITRVPGSDPRPGLVMLAPKPVRFSPGVMSADARARLLRSARLRGPELRLRLNLVDEVDVGHIPSRGMVGAALSALGVQDHLTHLRRERIASRSQACAPLLEKVGDQIAQLGGKVLSSQSYPWCSLEVTLPSSALAQVLALPDVATAGWSGAKGEPDSKEGCSLTSRFDEPLDRNTCKDDVKGTPQVYMDTLNLATGAAAYTDGHFDGKNIEGISGWAQAQDEAVDPDSGHTIRGGMPHVGLAIIDAGLYPAHPAFFDIDGTTRVDAMIDADLWGELSTTPNPASWFWAFAYPAYNHGTAVAAIAAGNLTDGQDARFTSADQQEARSGVARGTRLIFAPSRHLGSSKLRDVVDYLEAENLVPDVLDASNTHNTGIGLALDYLLDDLCATHPDSWNPDLCAVAAAYEPAFQYECATDEEGRGVDDLSLRMTQLYFDGVVISKSAGNQHTGSSSTSTQWCQAIDPDDASSTELTCPAGAAGVMSVGALVCGNLTAEEIQTSARLVGSSSRGTTEDGRTFPLLVAAHYQCGAANWNTSKWLEPIDYVDMGATSGAAPRVAGAFAVFKHWYLLRQPEVANKTSRLMVNLLNMADGYGQDVRGNRIDVPAPGWGLGRLRMRLFEDGSMGGTWYRHTENARLHEGESETFVIGKSDVGYLSRETQRLRITIWWPEVNLGEGEDKAEIVAVLVDDDFALDWRSSTNGDPIRFDYDCQDSFLGKPPTGDVSLYVYAIRAPTEVRGHTRDYRAVNVAWFWETGADGSRITCSLITENTCDIYPWA